MEELEEGAIHDAQSVYTQYPDPGRDEWDTKMLPKLKAMPMRKLIGSAGCRARRCWRYERGGDRIRRIEPHCSGPQPVNLEVMTIEGRTLFWRATEKDLLAEAKRFPRRGDRHYEVAPVSGWRTRGEHVLAELVGTSDPYYIRFVEFDNGRLDRFWENVDSGIAIIEAVYDDLQKSRLRSFRE